MANRLKELRVASSLSIGQLSKLSGLTFQTIWNIENGKVSDEKIIWRTVKKLAASLGKKAEEIFF